jgi:hypothetical protein
MQVIEGGLFLFDARMCIVLPDFVQWRPATGSSGVVNSIARWILFHMFWVHGLSSVGWGRR